MTDILSIIALFNFKEQQEFINYLKKKNRRGDTKNVQLFKLLAQGKTHQLDEHLYGKPNKNALHALSKRLKDRLIDFVASKSFEGETSEELHILKLLLTARILFEHKKYTTAFNILNKAEALAKELNLYSILSEIYHTAIQYAHISEKRMLNDIIKAAKKNRRLFEREQDLNMMYASIKNQLKNNPKNKTSQEILIESFSTFDIKIDATLTYKSLAQLLTITATSAQIQSDFYNALPFMNEIYSLISEKDALSNKNRYYHLEVLHSMGLAHFRNKNFKKTAYFLAEMERLMNHSHNNRFKEKHCVLKGLYETYTNKLKQSVATLQAYNEPSLAVDLTLCMSLFQQEAFDSVYKIVKSFTHSDAFYEKKMGWVWVLKKSIIEILTLIELDKFDVSLHRMERFKRNFKKRLLLENEQRVLVFIELVALYYEQPKNVTSTGFKEKVESSFEWIGKEREDIFVMSFYAWLKSKMESKSVYETTLTLVQK